MGAGYVWTAAAASRASRTAAHGVASAWSALQLAASSRSASKFSLSGDWLELFTPDEWLAIIVIIICAFDFLGMLAVQGGRLNRRLEEVSQKTEQLLESYETAANDMSEVLSRFYKSSNELAERHMDGKRRDFVKFLTRVRDHGLTFHSDICREMSQWDSDESDEGNVKMARPRVLTEVEERSLVAFREFVGWWLTAFEECSRDPLAWPRRPVRARELERCASVEEVAGLVVDRLAKNQVVIVSKDKCKSEDLTPTCQRIKTLRTSRADCLWLRFTGSMACAVRTDQELSGPLMEVSLCCLQLTVLSGNHLRMLLTLAVGLAAVATEVLLRKWHFAAAVLVGVAMLCFVLRRMELIDAIGQMQREAHVLEKETEVARRRHMKVKMRSDKARLFTNLWNFRTMPLLDILQELHEAVWDGPEEQAVAFLEGANAGIEQILADLGPLALWSGGDSLSKGTLQKVARQLHAVADFIKERGVSSPTDMAKVHDRLCHPFAFLAVLLLSANELPFHRPNEKSGASGVSGLVVHLSMGNMEVKSRRAKISQNPDWDEKFLMPVTEKDRRLLRLEVVEVSGGSTHSVAWGFVDFADLEPGNWLGCSVALELRSTRGGSANLSIVIQLACSVSQLADLMQPCSDGEEVMGPWPTVRASAVGHQLSALVGGSFH